MAGIGPCRGVRARRLAPCPGHAPGLAPGGTAVQIGAVPPGGAMPAAGMAGPVRDMTMTGRPADVADGGPFFAGAADAL
ncbi:hypothetical protein SAMN05421641_10831 [Paracoccus thiocyanatus]|uniref:Uncharacterized protein n=1 Tax=Paracoccus thiocyanatus TaxID=34006 RepID=A0A1N6SWZ0_9RHOB|nr:hypothetical protein SAMN05421641_10831 [Paracoccus thiocyanatus]